MCCRPQENVCASDSFQVFSIWNPRKAVIFTLGADLGFLPSCTARRPFSYILSGGGEWGAVNARQSPLESIVRLGRRNAHKDAHITRPAPLCPLRTKGSLPSGFHMITCEEDEDDNTPDDSGSFKIDVQW